MKLAVVKKLVIEQLPDDVKKWITVLTDPLNTFMDGVVRALQGQLTLRDNIKSQVISISIESNQVYPLKIAYNLNEKPTSVFVGSLTPSDGTVATFGLLWVLNNGSLEITFSGLTAVKHSLTLIAQV